jgi:hypothetical protein
LAFMQMTPMGGRIAGVDVLVSDSLPVQSALLVDASQIAASASTIGLDASNQATIQMDTAPDSPPTGNTVLTNLWHSNLVGLRATRFWAAERMRANAAALITGINYAGGSP